MAGSYEFGEETELLDNSAGDPAERHMTLMDQTDAEARERLIVWDSRPSQELVAIAVFLSMRYLQDYDDR